MFGTNSKEIKVGGMMCDHCVATVKRILSEIDGVKSVDVKLKPGTATIKYKGDFPLEKIQAALKEADYTFEGEIS